MKLELEVIKNTKGILETNISQLEEFVTSKLEEYKPEFYKGDSDAAKKDRAELNKSEKALSSARKELIAELMRPYQDFETRCIKLEKMIKEASSKLDEIVKLKEDEEKQAKREKIKLIWNEQDFSLVTLEKVFNAKWLNKTTKESVIRNEIQEIIKNIYNDLKIIEKYTDDAETIKAFYLDSLNISDTLDFAEELKKNREKVIEEEKTRDVRETKENLEQQEKELKRDVYENAKSKEMDNLVAQALHIEVKEDAINEYVISFNATAEQVLDIRKYLLSKSIVINSCEKLEF